jgi:hypothetical protein
MNRTFSPVVNEVLLLPEQYVQEYYELGEAEETRGMRGIELMWCWYFASPDSPFVRKGYLDRERSVKVTHVLFDELFKDRPYDEKTINKLKKGEIPMQWHQAIEFFRRIDTTARARAKDSLNLMFDKYNEIIEGGTDNFKNKDTEEVDFEKYVKTMKMIRNEIKDMIKEREYGFAVSEKKLELDEDETEGSYWSKMYLKTK